MTCPGYCTERNLGPNVGPVNSQILWQISMRLWCWAVHTGPVEGTGPSGHPHEMSFSLFGHTSGVLEAGGILLDYLCNIDRVQVFMKV